MNNLQKLLSKYDYHLPPELIAQAPAKPRESARLLVYNRNNYPSPKHGEGAPNNVRGGRGLKIKFDTFKNIGKYLPKNAILVFNQTKVWPARLEVVKPSGGKARLLYISHDKKFIKALSDRPLPLSSDVALTFGRTIVQQTDKRLKLNAAKKSGQFYYLKPNFPLSNIQSILKTYGVTPLPPYIKHSPLTEKQRREQYQTVFAKTGLSVAAPTASLHFTKKLMGALQKQGIDIKFVQLDVGLGTFASLLDENIKTGKLHQEFYSIDKKTANFLNQAKHQGRPIIAVGTTVARTLESSANHRKLTRLARSTSLFIRDNYQFKFIDGLITNFHVPKSSLLMLVSALAGRKNILKLYQQAIKKKFRFFSFGDGMLILP